MHNLRRPEKKRSRKRVVFLSVGIILIGLIGLFLYKASNVLTITGSGTDVGVYKDFSLEDDPNRLTVLILGIRGVDDAENGGLLADSIIIASFDKKKEEAALVSLPRDLLTDMPDHDRAEKLNFAYALGEQRAWGGGGLSLSREVVQFVTGVHIDHVVSVNFASFERAVDILGGVQIYRDTEFAEGSQWRGEGMDDSPFWRVAHDGEGAEYWEFYVPVGTSTLNGGDALYYVRSRFSSSDFDRMRRQQQVTDALKTKALSLGVLSNPIKVFDILDVLGDNIRTSMGLSDIREVLSLAQRYSQVPIETGFLDDSVNGPLAADNRDGQYVLVPKSGDFNDLRDFFANVFKS